MPEQGVVVKTHLCVHREHMALFAHDQRIDLHHDGVKIAHGAVTAEDDRGGLIDLGLVHAQGKGDLARLKGLHADRRFHGDLDDRLRLFPRQLLDLHAALGRGHHHDALCGAIQHKGQIELALDIAAGLDVQTLADLAALSGLMGDQLFAEQFISGGIDLVLAPAQLDAAGLAARAGVDLGLDHPDLAADLRCPVSGLLRAVGQPALADRYPVSGQDLFGLIFMDIHVLPLFDH